MKKLIWLVLQSIITWNGYSQGIHFTDGLTWNQIKEKARTEKKYIFLDAYATWCIPCKMMDKNVYSHDSVGTAINGQYISVKVQFDKTDKDSWEVRSWYEDVDTLSRDYNITAFPTFLFFTPDGALVHRGSGYLEPQSFISLSRDALNSEMHFATMLKSYQEGKKNYALFPKLISAAAEMGKDSLAGEVTKDYKQNHLNKLTEEELLTKEHVEFLGANAKILSSDDLIFKIAQRYPGKLDKIMGSGFAQRLTNYIIAQQEIYRKIKNTQRNNDRPNWSAIAKRIDQKYGKGMAKRLILDARIGWHHQNKEWAKLIQVFIEKQETYGLDTSGFGKIMINNFSYEVIFKHSNDCKVLRKAIAWMEVLLSSDSYSHAWLDTYASLLYKAGEITEAVEQEEKALTLAINLREESNIKIYTSVIDEMRRAVPIWK